MGQSWVGGQGCPRAHQHLIALGLITIGAALPTLQASFAQSPQAGLLIQLIGSIAAPAFAIASPLAGFLVASYGVKAVYLASLIAFLVVGAAPATGTRFCLSLSCEC